MAEIEIETWKFAYLDKPSAPMASGRVCESGIGIGIEIVVEIVFVIVIAIDDRLRVSQCCANTYDMYVYITRWHWPNLPAPFGWPCWLAPCPDPRQIPVHAKPSASSRPPVARWDRAAGEWCDHDRPLDPGGAGDWTGGLDWEVRWRGRGQ